MPEKLQEFSFLTLASIFDFLRQTRLEIGGKSVSVGKTTIFADLVDLLVLPAGGEVLAIVSCDTTSILGQFT